MAQSLAEYFASSLGRSILSILIGPAEAGSEFAANRATFLRIRLEAMQEMFLRAVERGELRQGIDTEIALDLALGPLYVRTLLTRKPIGRPFIEHYVDALLQGLVG
jgi:hypothetical protein